MNTRTLWVVVGVAALGVLAGCGDGSVSGECPDGSWAPGGDAGSVCVEWTPCPAGQYELGPGTATSDRVCTPCTSGSTDRACVPDRDCVPGEYINTASTGTGGAACTSCPSGTFSGRTNARSCMTWHTCEAGQYVLANGVPAGDRVCGACPSGRFSTTSNAASCTPWTTCEAGQRELSPGSDVNDRTCLACPPGTYTTGPNQTMCVSAGDCLPGTVQTVDGTPTSPAVCTACTAGQHCAGATSPAVACAVDTWDHDADPATACVPRTVCGGGTYMVAAGTPTEDRTCAGCPSGTFNAASSNVSMCLPWRDCFLDQVVDEPGTPLSNPTCRQVGWSVQFGSSRDDEGLSVSAVGSLTAVGGRTDGTLPGQTSLGGWDAFVQMHIGGVPAWTRQFGGNYDDRVSSVSFLVGGAVYVAGSIGLADSTASTYFVQLLDLADGTPLGTHDISWPVAAVAGMSDNGFVVVGQVVGALPGQTSSGSVDAVVQRYGPTGLLLWTRQFGTSLGARARAVSVGSDGSIVVVGATFGAFPGYTNMGEEDAFVRKYASDGTLLWTRQFGSLDFESVSGVSVGAGGELAVAGTTYAALPGQTHLGGADAFVRTYDSDGLHLWTRQFGGTGSDNVSSVSIAPNGLVLVAGGTGPGSWNPTGDGSFDAFLVTYDGSGTLLRTRHFGSVTGSGGFYDSAWAVSTAPTGRAVIAGVLGGALPGRVSAGGRDAFVRSFDEP